MTLEWIEGEQISLVFQGPVGDAAALASRLSAARAAMPAAEIVLSTWTGANVDTAWPVDHVVFSDDPGPIYVDDYIPSPNNISRQATSTAAGVALATRPFVAKVRTDFNFTAARLPIGPPVAADAPFRVFSRPITIVASATRDPYTSSMPFHPADFFTFGARADVMHLWAFEREPLSLARPLISHWERLRVWRYGIASGRYVPEVELTLSLLRRSGYGAIADRVTHFFTSDDDIRAKTLQFLQVNYRAFSFAALGLDPPHRLTVGGIPIGNVATDPATGLITRSPIDDVAGVRWALAAQTLLVLAFAPFGRKAVVTVFQAALDVRKKLKRR